MVKWLCGEIAFRLHARVSAATALRALLLAGAVLTPGWAAGQKTLTLQGMVVEDSSAQPLAEAEIVLNGGAHRATSDEKGTFTIAGLAEGEQVITIRLLGFTPLTTAFTLTSENASSIIEFGLVRSVQQALRDKGVDAGPVDGIWGARTSDGVRRFQEQQGLETTGQLNAPTLAALGIGKQQASAGESAAQR